MMINAGRCRLVAALVASVLSMMLTPLPASAQAAAPQVVVTIKPVHSLVAGVMAGVATPRLLVEGAASAHSFSLKPSAARAVHDADVVIRVSAALEPFTAKLAGGLPSKTKLVTLAEVNGVTVLKQRRGGTFETHGAHAGEDAGHDAHNDAHDRDAHDVLKGEGTSDHDGHDLTAYDGHIWLDPNNAKAIVAHVAEVLAATDVAHAETYRSNAAKLAQRIDAMAAGIATELKPVAGTPFVVFHDAYQYFERSFGLTVAGSVTVSPDVQPSALRLSEVRNKIAALGAVCVFAEPTFQPKLVAAVTEGTTARSGTLDPEGMALEPGSELYFELMQRLSANIKACLLPPA